MRWAAKKRSATIPIKNGEIIVAIAKALYAAPICTPEDFKNSDMYVLIVTYQDPHIKYSKSIITESLVKVAGFILSLINERNIQGSSYGRNYCRINYFTGDVPVLVVTGFNGNR